MSTIPDPFYDQGQCRTWEKLAQTKARGAEYNSNERRHFSRCLPGTRKELFDELWDVMTGEAQQVVWLFGESGSGKSSVAYTMAENFGARDQLAATFFFSRTHVGRGDTKLVFLTLAYQIGLLHPRARSIITKAIADDPELLSPTKSWRDQFELLVKAPLQSLKNVWKTQPRVMILDAVDEGVTSDRDANECLIFAMKELVHDRDIPISHILVTSRPDPLLVNASQSLAIKCQLTTLDMWRFSSNHDVELFLRHSFDELYVTHGIEFLYEGPWPSSAVIRAMSARIKGRFIVAATLVRLVEKAESPSDCLDLISKMYDGTVDTIDLDLGDIDSIYRYVLSSCEDRYHRSGVEHLSDIVALARPLTLFDICALFGMDISKNILHLSAIIDLPPDPMRSSRIVQVYHVSIRDYLWDASRSGDLYVSSSSSHTRLASRCLRIMKQKLRKDGPQAEDRKEAKSLRYAVSYWGYHLQRSEPSRQIQALVLDFTRNRATMFLEKATSMRQFGEAMYGLIHAKFIIMRWKPFPYQDEILTLLELHWRNHNPYLARKLTTPGILHEEHTGGPPSVPMRPNPGPWSPLYTRGPPSVPMHWKPAMWSQQSSSGPPPLSTSWSVQTRPYQVR
ncbi:hypothetical protein CONPUDRAFT_166611 [Coniophora puteana RWD-64-598 SS2]|uniref:NACHT domain-containing protein n=1 Tax=Coniophora puteana (strain RWD-64-598) TaxID=741705 RepID=A0A5M3MLJ0_CONPW|nr:uncharacterized protein CONPUDRAFT_166611 [Coniophora puteana RWD-64-598 SS2]EIW79963.1 hypothetical protein CONPUDRAFT_166611 [Coniophora puteana RWD-64-598 SS2]